MGGSESKDVVNAYVGSLLSICDSATQNCWTQVTGDNDILVYNSSDVVIQEINQGMIWSLDTDCSMSVTSNTCVDENMDYQAQQHADAVSKGYGFKTADAETYLNLAQTMVTQVKNNYSQNLYSTAQLNNVISISGSSDVTVSGVNQSQTYSSEITGMMSIDINNQVATEMTTMIDQYTSAESSQSMGLFLIAVAVIIVLVLLTVGMFSDLLFNPAFWFMCSTVGLILSGYFVMAYFPQWWPYKEIDDDDTDDSKQKKQDSNKNELYGWLISLAVFGGIDIILIALSLMSKKAKQQKQQKAMQQAMVGAMPIAAPPAQMTPSMETPVTTTTM